MFDELTILVERHIKPRSSKQFILPGLLKIEVKRKPATKARKGTNPFTGEEMMFKAKPARDIVKIRPLKKVKDMVG
ncbi:MAG: HU family DNA-binding protein [Desulfobacterales bacterium]|nr:HU family DNA-binding protein [Desulfobacterales bacterium]